jgi:uncharacterized protein YukE
VPWYGDPDELARLATRLARRAEGVRGEAVALRLRVARLRWQGAAADAFHAAFEHDLARVRLSAQLLDEAAALMRRHAAQVRETLARIRAIEAAVTGWFTDQLRTLERAAGAVVDAVTDPLGTVRRAVEDPPWTQWRWQPGNLPESGSMEWLDVGDFFHRAGVLG